MTTNERKQLVIGIVGTAVLFGALMLPPAIDRLLTHWGL